MPKLKAKKKIFRLVHLEAAVFIALYFLVSNAVLVGSLASKSLGVAFLGPIFFGIAATFAFLYLFSHKDFFHFIRKLEDEEREKEKKYLNRFKRFGKMIACVLISAVGGPIFLALTVRFLFSKSENRYSVAFVATLVSTIIIVAMAKGLLKIIF
jgi:hypothetical protein